MPAIFFIHNGKVFTSNENTISICTSPLKYGEGFFETMLAVKGVLLRKDLHFNRIGRSFQLLNYKKISQSFLNKIEYQINELLIKNNHLNSSRVRVMFFKKSLNSLYNQVNFPDYIIESFAIDYSEHLNKIGLTLGTYDKVIIPCDAFSKLKSNSYQPYLLAAGYAKQNQLDDSIILNMYGRVCETSIANIFIIRDDKIFTPSLSEGCVDGVMREFLLALLKQRFQVTESEITLQDLYAADEVFITNAIRGIRWIKTIDHINYKNKFIRKIYRNLNSTK